MRRLKKNQIAQNASCPRDIQSQQTPPEYKFFLVSQQEGLQVGGWMSSRSLTKPGMGLGGVRPQVLCSEIRPNG